MADTSLPKHSQDCPYFTSGRECDCGAGMTASDDILKLARDCGAHIVNQAPSRVQAIFNLVELGVFASRLRSEPEAAAAPKMLKMSSQWQTHAERSLAAFADRLRSEPEAAASEAAVLEGVVALAREAHAHWDADRDAKVGKIIQALAGWNSRYDKRADALHEAIERVPIPASVSDSGAEPSDEQILHRWDTHVGTPNDRLPLTDKDKIEFARAVLALRASTTRNDEGKA